MPDDFFDPAATADQLEQAHDKALRAPVLLLVSREADAWLASWSRAEAVVGFPVDPVTLPTQVATLIRARLAQPAAQ